jgi:hypothetical protein
MISAAEVHERHSTIRLLKFDGSCSISENMILSIRARPLRHPRQLRFVREQTDNNQGAKLESLQSGDRRHCYPRQSLPLTISALQYDPTPVSAKPPAVHPYLRHRQSMRTVEVDSRKTMHPCCAFKLIWCWRSLHNVVLRKHVPCDMTHEPFSRFFIKHSNRQFQMKPLRSPKNPSVAP